MNKEITVKYTKCPLCETKVQYTDQDVHYDDESELDQYGNEIGYDYFEWIICPECGKRIIVDEG